MRAIEPFFMLASAWGKTRCSRIRRPLTDALWLDVLRGQQTSVSRAKGAIAKYEKALGDPEGVTELLVFYCERAAGFCEDADHRDAAYLDAIVRVFEGALKAAANLTGNVQSDLLSRLDCVRSIGRQLGNGVGEEMNVLLSKFESSTYPRGVPWKRT